MGWMQDMQEALRKPLKEQVGDGGDGGDPIEIRWANDERPDPKTGLFVRHVDRSGIRSQDEFAGEGFRQNETTGILFLQNVGQRGTRTKAVTAVAQRCSDAYDKTDIQVGGVTVTFESPYFVNGGAGEFSEGRFLLTVACPFRAQDFN